MSEYTPETLRAMPREGADKDEPEGVRYVQISDTLLNLIADAWEALEKRLGHEAARLREAICECEPRAPDYGVPLDNVPGHHDFSCPYRTGAPGGLLDAATLAPSATSEAGPDTSPGRPMPFTIRVIDPREFVRDDCATGTFWWMFLLTVGVVVAVIVLIVVT